MKNFWLSRMVLGSRMFEEFWPKLKNHVEIDPKNKTEQVIF